MSAPLLFNCTSLFHHFYAPLSWHLQGRQTLDGCFLSYWPTEVLSFPTPKNWKLWGLESSTATPCNHLKNHMLNDGIERSAVWSLKDIPSKDWAWMTHCSSPHTSTAIQGKIWGIALPTKSFPFALEMRCLSCSGSTQSIMTSSCDHPICCLVKLAKMLRDPSDQLESLNCQNGSLFWHAIVALLNGTTS